MQNRFTTDQDSPSFKLIEENLMNDIAEIVKSMPAAMCAELKSNLRSKDDIEVIAAIAAMCCVVAQNLVESNKIMIKKGIDDKA